MPLTRDEAARRRSLLRVESYDVELDVTGAAAGESTFRSVTTVRFAGLADGESFVELRAERLHQLSLDGDDLPDASWDRASGRIRIAVSPGDHELHVAATVSYSVDGEGLHRHVDPADGRTYLYAMSFLDAAPRWFACFDQPDLKASFTLTVHCPLDWTVAGNGPAETVAPGTWRVRQDRPLATYLATVVAGPYHSVRGEHDGIPLVVSARASLAHELDRDAEALLSHTSRCFDEFHRLFAVRYPWGEYHQVFVPEFNAGAMENPGCVTISDAYLFRSQPTSADLVDRADTMAHEMAHMWFGDLVTMRWWDDLWLNESFAEYLGHRVCDAIGLSSSWVQFGIDRKAWGYAADRRPSTHPVAGNGVADSAAALSDFDGISYAKGAAVLKQLAARLGDAVFLGGLRDYIAAHRFGNAELTDLVDAWTRAGAAGLPDWTAGWLRSAGTDTIKVVDGRLALVPPAGASARREHAFTAAAFDVTARELHRTDVLLSDQAALAASEAAFVLPDVADETWARIELDPPAWEALRSALPRLDPLARVVVWNALRAGVSEATISPLFAVSLVTECVRDESDAVLSELLEWLAGSVLATYVWPSDKEAAATTLLAAARDIADAAEEPGRRIAAVRAVLAVTSDAAELRALLSAGEAHGLPLDADLRWRLWLRLSTLGACSAAELDEAERADHTAEGAEKAARCRAALPTPDAKREAWRLLTEPNEASNALLLQTARGFWQPNQVDATAIYVPRWFDEYPRTAEYRSGWSVTRVAESSFPWTAIDAEVVSRAAELAARADVAAGVRRAAIDCGDDVRRALASRGAFPPR